MKPTINEKWCMSCNGHGYKYQNGQTRICVACKGRKTVRIEPGDRKAYKKIARTTEAVMKLNERARTANGLLVGEDEVFDAKYKAWENSKGGFSFDEWLRINK